MRKRDMRHRRGNCFAMRRADLPSARHLDRLASNQRATVEDRAARLAVGLHGAVDIVGQNDHAAAGEPDVVLPLGAAAVRAVATVVLQVSPINSPQPKSVRPKGRSGPSPTSKRLE